MKLLLTSGGVSNLSIQAELVRLIGKPIAESTALAIPTAEYGHPMCTPQSAWSFASGRSPAPMVELGWQQMGLLELMALPTIGVDRWLPWVQAADVLLVDGGDARFLAHWVRESGLLEAIPSLEHTVWVGVSAGSMVMTPRIGDMFVTWRTDGWTDETLGLVDFSIFPHLDVFPSNTLEAAHRWAGDIGGPAYVLDDQSAISVVGDDVRVVSEGEWHRLD